MKRKPTTMLLLIVISFTLFSCVLFSCAVQNEATIKSSGAGSVHFNIRLEKYFFDTILEMSDLAEESKTLPQGEVFDVVKIKNDFQENPSIRLNGLETPRPWILRGSFDFQDIEAVFEQEEELQAAKIVRFSGEGDTKRITVHVDRENFSRISTLFPMLEDPFFKMFGPEENADVTEEEYIEMIEFAFGEAGARGVQNSTIKLIAHIDGTIVSQTGGKVNGNDVIFTIPLLQALRLEEPLDYSVVFK